MLKANTPERDELQPHLDLLSVAARALDAGRTPRARNPLKKAARALQAAGRHDRAEEAHRLLARLELRTGNARRALNAGRAALRAARAQGRESRETLSLLAWLYAASQDVNRAIRTARRGLEVANGDHRVVSDAWILISELEAGAGDLARAATSAEEALRALPEECAGEAQLQVARVLLRCGCSQEAEAYARAVSLRTEAAVAKVRAQLVRGNAKLHAGALEGAARYFRAASKAARGLDDGRLEALALGALGAVERVRRAGAVQRANPFTKATRLAKKLKDARVLDVLEQLEANGLGRPPFPTPKAAARQLVSLAQESESELLAGACTVEVQYLCSLDPGAPPYPYPPLPLDLPLL